MGSVTFNFLRDSPLFDPHRIEEHYRDLSESRLQQELASYRAHVISNLPELRAEIADRPGSLRLLGADHFQSVAQLTQAAFYLDQVVLKDPLFPHSEQHDEVKRHMNLALGARDLHVVDREAVAQAAGLMRRLTPMVAANFVTFFPTSLFEERPEVPLLAPGEDRFPEVLPPGTGEIYRKHAVVRNAISEDGRLLISKSLQTGRAIVVNFGDDTGGYIYRLVASAPKIVDEEKRLVQFVFAPIGASEEPVSEDEFRHWVEQSLNQSAADHFNRVRLHQQLAAELDLHHLTASSVTAEVLGHSAEPGDIQNFAATTLLNLDLPVLSGADPAWVMSVRQDDGEAFQAFRREWEKSVRELRLESDPSRRALKLKTTAPLPSAANSPDHLTPD